MEIKRLLLGCGADVVFDTLKTTAEECRAQMVAIWDRYLISKEGADQQFSVEQAILKIFPGNLSNRETAVARVLLTNKLISVSRKDIVNLADLANDIKTENALSLLINLIFSKTSIYYENKLVSGCYYGLTESIK